MDAIDRVIDTYFADDENRKKEVCCRMGMNYGTFCRKTNQNDDLIFNIRELIPYTLNTDFSLIDHIESRLGRVAFKLPKKESEVTTKNIAEMIEVMTKAISDMVNIISDGKIDEKEKAHLNTLMISLNQQGIGLHAKINNN